MLTKKLLAALELARERHHGQERKHGLPYVFHPEEIAGLLAFRYGVADENVLCAALLHDVVEESDTRAEEIAERFGQNVAEMVVALTRDKARPYGEYVDRLVEQPPEVALIKGVDVLSNLRDSLLAKRQTRRRVPRKAEDHILPLLRAKLGSEHQLVCDLEILLAALPT